MSKRYIDADELIRTEIARCHCIPLVGYSDDNYKLFDEVINDVPTADVVEVVRCRECKYCLHYVTPTLERYECHYYGCSDEVVNYVEPMYYCAYGERREE